MPDQFALQSWATAEYHFAQAIIQPEPAAGTTVHAAYYAMFYAARAVLLRVNGSAPKKHSSVISAAVLIDTVSPAFRDAARALSVMLEQRIKADYEADTRLTQEQARSAVTTSQAFLELCAAGFGFPLPPGADA